MEMLCPTPGLCISFAVSGVFLADFAWKFFISIVHAVHLAQVFLNKKIKDILNKKLKEFHHFQISGRFLGARSFHIAFHFFIQVFLFKIQVFFPALGRWVASPGSTSTKAWPRVSQSGQDGSNLWVRYVPSIYHLFIIYLSSIYHLFIIYSSSIYHLFIIYLSSIYHLFIIYLSSIYHLFIIYLSSIYHLFIIYLSSIYHIMYMYIYIYIYIFLSLKKKYYICMYI